MATLINMENTAEEAKQQVDPSMVKGPKYPWGLTISLDDDSLKKLGIDTLPEVGTAVMVVAKATVASVSARQSEGGENYRCLDLQLTDMQVSGTQKDRMGRATEALYGKANAS